MVWEVDHNPSPSPHLIGMDRPSSDPIVATLRHPGYRLEFEALSTVHIERCTGAEVAHSVMGVVVYFVRELLSGQLRLSGFDALTAGGIPAGPGDFATVG